jgi:hypothetical protein
MELNSANPVYNKNAMVDVVKFIWGMGFDFGFCTLYATLGGGVSKQR